MLRPGRSASAIFHAMVNPLRSRRCWLTAQSRLGQEVWALKFTLACSRFSVVRDERKRAGKNEGGSPPSFFSLALPFSPSPTTESLEQAKFADAIQHAHKDCKNKHAIDTAIILFALFSLPFYRYYSVTHHFSIFSLAFFFLLLHFFSLAKFTSAVRSAFHLGLSWLTEVRERSLSLGPA